jgi:hypothetical protein
LEFCLWCVLDVFKIENVHVELFNLSLIMLLFYLLVAVEATENQAGPNDPFRPGNLNFPPIGGGKKLTRTPDAEKSFPVINVHYDFAGADLDPTRIIDQRKFDAQMGLNAANLKKQINEDWKSLNQIFTSFLKLMQLMSIHIPSSFLQETPNNLFTALNEPPEYPIINLGIESNSDFVARNSTTNASLLERFYAIQDQHILDFEAATNLTNILVQQIRLMLTAKTTVYGYYPIYDDTLNQPSSFLQKTEHSKDQNSKSKSKSGKSHASFKSHKNRNHPPKQPTNSTSDIEVALLLKISKHFKNMSMTGLTGAKDLAALLNLTGNPRAVKIMKKMKINDLLKLTLNTKSRLSDLNRSLIGTLISKIEGNRPVIANLIDDVKDSFSHLDIILPRHR